VIVHIVAALVVFTPVVTGLALGTWLTLVRFNYGRVEVAIGYAGIVLPACWMLSIVASYRRSTSLDEAVVGLMTYVVMAGALLSCGVVIGWMLTVAITKTVEFLHSLLWRTAH